MAPMDSNEIPASVLECRTCNIGSKQDDFDSAVSFVLEHEGSRLNPNDNGAGASKYGILQKTLKQIDPKGRIARDVSRLDERKAKEVYKKIWDMTGCDKLPHPLNVVHFDTVVHSPRTAARALNSSEGNADQYLESRLSTLKGLKSYQKYGKNWSDRIDDLSRMIDRS
jgi:lysozyme family protein